VFLTKTAKCKLAALQNMDGRNLSSLLYDISPDLVQGDWKKVGELRYLFRLSVSLIVSAIALS